MPYISFIFPARVDNHLGNFLVRLKNSLNALLYLGNKYNLDYEIIFVEWNPLPDMPSLASVLSDIKNTNGRIRILTIPNEIHKSIPETPYDAAYPEEITFFGGIGFNAALRRTNAEYILCSTCDIVFNEPLIEYLSKKQLSNECFYRMHIYDCYDPLKGDKSFKLYDSIDELLEFCETHCYRRLDTSLIRMQAMTSTVQHQHDILLEKKQVLEKNISELNKNRERFLNDIGNRDMHKIERAQLRLLEQKISRIQDTIEIVQGDIAKKKAYIKEENVLFEKCLQAEESPLERATGDFVLASRSIFEKVKGFAEIRCSGDKLDSLILWNFMIYAKQKILYPPMKMFHQWHPLLYQNVYNLTRHGHSSRDPGRTWNKMTKKLLRKKRQSFAFNHAKYWGLYEYELPETIL